MPNDVDRNTARQPFQFTIRTLLVLTLVVAMFCSAAETFQGTSRLLAFAILAWAVAGPILWKIGATRDAVLVHLGAPILYAVAIWSDRGSDWKGPLAAGFFFGAVYSILIVLLRRRW